MLVPSTVCNQPERPAAPQRPCLSATPFNHCTSDVTLHHPLNHIAVCSDRRGCNDGFFYGEFYSLNARKGSYKTSHVEPRTSHSGKKKKDAELRSLKHATYLAKNAVLLILLIVIITCRRLTVSQFTAPPTPLIIHFADFSDTVISHRPPNVPVELTTQLAFELWSDWRKVAIRVVL